MPLAQLDRSVVLLTPTVCQVVENEGKILLLKMTVPMMETEDSLIENEDSDGKQPWNRVVLGSLVLSRATCLRNIPRNHVVVETTCVLVRRR